MSYSDSINPNIGQKWKPSKVGYFRSNESWISFKTVYEQGMTNLRDPERVVDIATSFGTVRAYRFGTDERPPILLLPGRVSATPLWASNMPSLVERRSVWSIDLLGEPGLSVQNKRIVTAEDQAAWLAETIEGLDLNQVHLLGVSIGGWSAINIAIRRPERIASVIFLDPPITFANITFKMILVSMGTVVPFMPAKFRNKLLGWISGGVKSPEDLPEGRLVASSMKDFKGYLPVPSRPSDNELSTISQPVLGIFAGRSIVHDANRAATKARSVLKNAEIEVWPEASHAINGEFPEEIAIKVHSFLDRRS